MVKKDPNKAAIAALFAAIENRPGSFNEIFALAWPAFRRSYAGGEDLARLHSYELVHRMMMRGKVNKVEGVYYAAPPKVKNERNV